MTPPPALPERGRTIVGLLGVLAIVGAALSLAPSSSIGQAATIDQPTGDAEAIVETDPVFETGDAADDPAIWYNETDPAQSVVVGNDKKGSLEVYDLAGHRIQRIADGFYGNVDIRRGFTTGTGPVDLVVTWHAGIQVYTINPATRLLSNITDTSTGSIAVPTGGEGLCLYRSPVDGSTYVFVNSRSGHVAQYQLTDADNDGKIEGTLRRDWVIGSETEGCVADDELGWFYISEEGVGIWKYSAEPGAPSSVDARTLVDTTVARGGHILPDAEGLTIVYQPGGTGYLMASSQAASDVANSIIVYQRQDANAFVRNAKVITGSMTDGCGRTDGIDALAMDMGPSFPHGMFVCQDNANTQPSAGNQNFKLVPLERLVGLVSELAPTTTTTTTTTTLPVDTTTTLPGDTTTTSTTTTTTTTTTPPTPTPPTTAPPTTAPPPPTTIPPPPTNAISFVGGATANASATAHTVTMPASVRAGDSLLLLLATNNLATVSAPTGVTGWSQVAALASGSARSVVWQKVAVAADAGKVVRVALSASTKANLAVVVHRGTSLTAPVAAFARVAAPSGTVHSTPVVAVPQAGTWAVSYWTHRDSTTTSLIPPGGVQVRSNSTQTGASRITAMVADSGAAVTTSSYGGLVASGAATTWNSHVWTVILAPA